MNRIFALGMEVEILFCQVERSRDLKTKKIVTYSPTLRSLSEVEERPNTNYNLPLF